MASRRALLLALPLAVGACSSATTRPTSTASHAGPQPEPLSILVLEQGRYGVEGKSIGCEELSVLAMQRRPSSLIADTLRTLDNITCLDAIAAKLGIVASAYGSDGQLHEIHVTK